MNAFGHRLTFNTHTEWFIEHHGGDMVALRSWAGYALCLMPLRAYRLATSRRSVSSRVALDNLFVHPDCYTIPRSSYLTDNPMLSTGMDELASSLGAFELFHLVHQVRAQTLAPLPRHRHRSATHCTPPLLFARGAAEPVHARHGVARRVLLRHARDVLRVHGRRRHGHGHAAATNHLPTAAVRAPAAAAVRASAPADGVQGPGRQQPPTGLERIEVMTSPSPIPLVAHVSHPSPALPPPPHPPPPPTPETPRGACTMRTTSTARRRGSIRPSPPPPPPPPPPRPRPRPR